MIDLMIAAQDAVAAAAQTAGDAVMETADALAQNAPAAQTAAETAKSVSIGFWELFIEGGWLMWVLVALAGVMIFIFVERFVAIRKATRIDDNFMNRIRDYIWEGKINSAVDLCRRTDSPVARMIEKGIERIGRPWAIYRLRSRMWPTSKWPSWKRVCRRWRLSPAVHL